MERFVPGQALHVLDVGFGLGTNSAVLLEACRLRSLRLHIHGLELDRAPLTQALATAVFRQQWQETTLRMLEHVLATGHWSSGDGHGAEVLWGDARRRLSDLSQRQFDLVMLDAFSPQRCPELWTLEFLGHLSRRLTPGGRLLTYSCAAAVREALLRNGLQIASIRPRERPSEHRQEAFPNSEYRFRRIWSFGTVASPTALPPESTLADLTQMEQEHLRTCAAEPYRDPQGTATSADILNGRKHRQAQSRADSTSSWRRRWAMQNSAKNNARSKKEPAA